MHYSAI